MTDHAKVPGRGGQPSANVLARQMHATRRAFGYEYKRYEYAESDIAALWKRSSPWATGSMVRSASNMSEALARDLSFRMPGHDVPLSPDGEPS